MIGVLVVDSNLPHARQLASLLGRRGYSVTCVSDRVAALSRIARFRLCLVSVAEVTELPLWEAFLLQLRVGSPRTRVLVLSEAPGIAASVLRAGAHDFLAVPFDADELSARLERFTRLRAQQPSARGELVLEDADRSATVSGSPLKLTPSEYDLLACLLKAQGQAVGRDTLALLMERSRPGQLRTVDSHLSHIRTKLRKAGCRALLESVYGRGYRLSGPAQLNEITQEFGEKSAKTQPLVGE